MLGSTPTTMHLQLFLLTCIYLPVAFLIQAGASHATPHAYPALHNTPPSDELTVVDGTVGRLPGRFFCTCIHYNHLLLSLFNRLTTILPSSVAYLHTICLTWCATATLQLLLTTATLCSPACCHFYLPHDIIPHLVTLSSSRCIMVCPCSVF